MEPFYEKTKLMHFYVLATIVFRYVKSNSKISSKKKNRNVYIIYMTFLFSHSHMSFFPPEKKAGEKR